MGSLGTFAVAAMSFAKWPNGQSGGAHGEEFRAQVRSLARNVKISAPWSANPEAEGLILARNEARR
jgi:hypothetical protein